MYFFFLIGEVPIVLKKIAFQIFIALILKVNMTESKNNWSLRLGPLEPTPEEKKSSKIQCEGPIIFFC